MEKSFKNYCSDLLQESKLTGISSIIKSEGWVRKLIKLLILSIGIIGFLLQAHAFVQVFWEFSVVSSVQRIGHMKKPAVTICDENLIRRRYFCENMTGMCQKMDETRKDTYCWLYSEYCLDPENMYIMLPIPEKIVEISKYPEEYFNINFTKASGFEIEKSLVLCEWVSKEDKATSCNEPQFVRGLTIDRRPGACYTLKSNAYGLDEQLEPDSALRMAVRWHPADTIVAEPSVVAGKHRERSYWIAFHYPGHVSNPFVEGFRIQEGKHYKIQLTQVDTIRLPPPYSTKCHDYVNEWKKNQFSGPLGREDCLATCQMNAKLEAYGCVPRDIEYPHEKKLCIGYKFIDPDLNAKMQNCMEGCSDACTETEYVADLDIEGEINYETGIKYYGSPTVARLEVLFDGSKSKTVLYRPKYESIELFSYIGSYLGMWLGWSLLALFDFVEIIFNLLKYPFTKRRKSHEENAERMFVHHHFY